MALWFVQLCSVLRQKHEVFGAMNCAPQRGKAPPPSFTVLPPFMVMWICRVMPGTGVTVRMDVTSLQTYSSCGSHAVIISYMKIQFTLHIDSENSKISFKWWIPDPGWLIWRARKSPGLPCWLWGCEGHCTMTVNRSCGLHSQEP